MTEEIKELGNRMHLYSLREEKLNVITHLSGAVIAFICLFLMAIKVRNNIAVEIISLMIFSICTLSVYSFSAIYHGSKNIKRKIFFQKIDHCMVSLIIAGTSVPTLTIIAKGTVAAIMLITVVIVTIFNVILNLISVQKYKKISLVLYSAAIILIGVGVIFNLQSFETDFLTPFLLGVASIIIGSVFYMKKSKEYTHFIWHLADLTGSLFHFIAFYFFIA